MYSYIRSSFCLFFILSALQAELASQVLSSNDYNMFYHKDSNGHLWVSSLSAWNKYNGVSTQFYLAGEEGIAGNQIQSALFEDKDGNLWSSTYEYLLKYDPRNDKFTSFQIKKSDQLENSSYHIIKIDKDNNILYINSESGISIFNISHLEQCCETFIETAARTFASETSGDTTLIVGMLWANGFGIEIHKFKEKESLSKQSYFGTQESELVFRDGIISKQDFWGVTDKGLVKFDLEEPESSIEYFKPVNEVNFYHVARIKNQLFLTSNRGLWVFDLATSEFVKNMTIDNGLLSDSPIELFSVDDKAIWFSHRDIGIQVLSLSEILSHRTSLISHSKSEIRVRKVLEDQKGGIVVVADEGEVNVLDTNKSVDINFQAFSSKNAEKIVVDAKLEEEGLLYILGTKSFHTFEIRTGKELTSDVIESGIGVAIDASETYSNFYSTTKMTKFLENENSLKNHHFSRPIFGLDTDDVSLWVDEKTQYFLQSKDSIYSLGNPGWPTQFSQNPFSRRIEFSTEKGIFKIDRNLINDLVDKVIPLDDIHGFAYDENRNLWFTRSKNIYVYTADSTLIRIPSEHDVEYSNSAPIFPDDEVWLATNKGVLTVSKDIYKHYNETPHTYVMEVHVNGLKFDSQLNPDYIENIDLSWQENDLNFRTEVGEYEGDSHQSIKYKLAGLETEWTYSTDFNISYKNLQPGNYTLEMIGIGSNLRESQLKTIDIKISPPYYQTWWFRGSIAGLLVLAGFAVNYYYTKRRLREQEVIIEKQKALQSQRNIMSQDLHDEMGSGLTTIKYISNALKKESDSEKIEQIENTSTNLIASMRDLLWSLDESNDTIGNLVSKSRTILNQMCKGSDIESSLDANIDKEYSIPGIHRRNIILIIKEAITNVRKHADASQIKISFIQDNKILKISITDDGKGMKNMTSLDSKSYGLNSIKKRVNGMGGEIEITSSNVGTTLQVDIPLVDS